jgi:light-regulated signal transduction histidine kinase (bacteriophytochrome)
VRALTQLLVRRDGSLPDDSDRLFTLIEQATSGMERLIDSLLRYAQAGQGQLNRRHVSVDQIIERAVVTLAPLITQTRARIVCEPLPAVDADPVLLELVLQNLISNGLSYHRPGEAPVIEISGVNSGDSWQFAVKDNGQGIPPDQQDRVFEPLKRLHWQRHPGHRFGIGFVPYNRRAPRRAHLG